MDISPPYNVNVGRPLGAPSEMVIRFGNAPPIPRPRFVAIATPLEKKI